MGILLETVAAEAWGSSLTSTQFFPLCPQLPVVEGRSLVDVIEKWGPLWDVSSILGAACAKSVGHEMASCQDGQMRLPQLFLSYT